MPLVDALSLALVPALPIGAGLLFFPLGGRVPRGLLALLLFATWIASGLALLDVAALVVEVGQWRLVDTGGYTGAVVRAGRGLPLTLTPLTLVVVALVHLGGGLLLVGARAAWGGGPHVGNGPASPAQRVAILLLTGLVELTVLVDGTAATVGALAVASTTGSAILLTARARPEGLMGASTIFALHRLGDAALVAFVATLALLGVPARLVDAVAAVTAVDPTFVLAEGPFAGFPAQTAVDALALLLVVGVLTRFLVPPTTGFLRTATGGPVPVLLAAHGLGGVVVGVVVLVKTASLTALAPVVTAIAVGALLVGAALHLALAAFSSDAVEVDLRVLYGLGSLVGATVLLGDAVGGVLGVALLVVVAPIAFLADGAAIEALQGNTDLWAMGGLWRALRRSDAARALATFVLVGTPGLLGFAFFDRALHASLASMRGNTGFAVLVVVVTVLVAWISWRSLHLTFAGDETRGPTPARLIEVSAERWGTWIVFVLVLVVVGPLFVLPEPILARVAPDAYGVLTTFVAPALSLEGTVLAEVTGEAMIPTALRAAGLVVLGVVPVVTYALSYRRARGRPRPPAPEQPSWLARLAARDLRMGEILSRALFHPVERLARAVSQVVRPVLVEGTVERVPQGAALLVAVTARLLHAGDIQRALAVVLAVVFVALVVWGPR